MPLIAYHFHISPPFWQHSSIYISRQPRPIVSYGNILLPFDLPTWILASVALFFLAIFFVIAHYVLNAPDLKYLCLVRKESSPTNFFLFTFAKFTEPGMHVYNCNTVRKLVLANSDPIPWFPKWTSGKFATLLWSLFSFLIIMFYTSNLRAHMVTINYEQPLDTFEAIVQNGQKVYLYNGAYQQR